MKHDPERHAAAYLGGLLKGARRKMFERHMVDCEDCWREVDLGRKGRSVAEGGREMAPQALRERVRAAVETVRPHRRRPPWIFGAGLAAIAALVVAVIVAMPAREPREIEAVLSSFRSGNVGAPTDPELPERLSELELVGATKPRLEGHDVVAHRYVDRSGDEVVVYVATEEWPVAVGAEHDNSGETWLAEKGELVMICLDEPQPLLVVGDDLHDVELAAYSLRP
ncbi:MAG: anti-sigma factor [Actinomycetota bacterium]